MRYKTIGHRVLVRPISLEADAKLPEGLAASKFKIVAGLDKNAEHRARSEVQIGIIVSLGPLCWKHPDYGYGLPEWEGAWPKEGDKVYYGKYSGYFLDDPNDPEEKLYLVNDDDIKMIVED